jgi:hypothetical protein
MLVVGHQPCVIVTLSMRPCQIAEGWVVAGFVVLLNPHRWTAERLLVAG